MSAPSSCTIPPPDPSSSSTPAVASSKVRIGLSHISPCIDPTVLNLKHRIGRCPFVCAWIVIHHQRQGIMTCPTEFDVKMLHQVRRGSVRSSANARAWAMPVSYMASRRRMGGFV